MPMDMAADGRYGSANFVVAPGTLSGRNAMYVHTALLDAGRVYARTHALSACITARLHRQELPREAVECTPIRAFIALAILYRVAN